MGQKLNVKTEHLNRGSHTEVVKVCDFCGKETPRIKFKDIIKARIDGADICKACSTSHKMKKVAIARAAAGNNLVELFPAMAADWDHGNNSGVLPSEVTPGSHFRASWIGAVCGHRWETTVYSRTAGTGCPICRVSKGEQAIQRQLEKFGLVYEAQKSFDGLVGVKGNSLLFDFAVLHEGEIACLIEYDGEQHFRPVNFSGENMVLAHERFGWLKEHDRKKDEWCAQAGIPLIRICYWDFDWIPVVLYGVAINLINKGAA
ncbi:hypothetical protein BJP49_11005 [Paenibacillus odorifer]|nr:hypothetical protein BJP49_11005 [Paenibacillus odorifer]